MSRQSDLVELTRKKAQALSSGSKNLIINGDMSISQRIAADTDAATANTYNCMDRWYCTSGWSVVNQRRDTTDAPVGFSNCLHVSSATGVSALAASNYWSTIQQLIEGHNIASLKWGTADARPVTLSFWVKSSQAGQWNVTLRNGSSNNVNNGNTTHCYVATYEIDVADTWERKEITILGPTVGSWNSTNGAGITVFFDIGSGSSYAGTTANSWVAGNFISSPNSNRLYDGNNQYIKLTGVQLEVGDTATEFEHRSYGDELARCQRYFFRRGNTNNLSGGYDSIGTGTGLSTSTCRIAVPYPCEMRTKPTCSFSGSITLTPATGGLSAINSNYCGDSGGLLDLAEGNTSISNGTAIAMYAQNSAGDYFDFDAEL
jgi:hypothetical protein